MSLSVTVVVDGQKWVVDVAYTTPPFVDSHRRQTIAEVERQRALGRSSCQVGAAVPRVRSTVPAVRLNHVVVAGFHVVVAYWSHSLTVGGTSDGRLTAIHVY